MTEILGRSAVLGIAVKQPQMEEESVFEAEESGGSRLESLLDRIPGRGIFLSTIGRFFGKLAALLPKRLPIPAPAPRFAPSGFFRKMTKERLLITVGVLAILLISGVFWLRSSSNQKKLIQEQQLKLNNAKELMSDAMTTGQFDKTKAAEYLATAEKSCVEVLNSRYLRGDAVKTLDDIQKQRDLLDDVRRIDSPTVVASLAEKRANASALGLLELKNRMFAFEYNALYEMVLDKLQDPITISDTESVILGTNYPDKESLLFLTRTGKMIEYADARFSLVTTKDGIWKKGVDMKSYNDRVYVLDPERNQVWKYIRRRDGFDAGEAYNQDADLAKAVALAIDSAIYVLNSDGFITQLYQGKKVDYPLRRLPLKPVKTPTKIYTSQEMNRLFILEPSEQRVVVYRKDPKNGGAQYQNQYVFKNTGILRDLIVSDTRLYVIDDKKVYVVNMGNML